MKQFNFENAKQIHQNKYNYDNVIYKNVDTKVIIHCPLHGDFYQTPYKHINMKQGCPKCKGMSIRKSKQKTLADYIKLSKNIHGEKYTYPISQIVNNAHHKISIICPIHGEFKQNFNNHIYNKCGCPNCGYNISNLEKEWIASLNIPHIQTQKQLVIQNKRFKVDGFDSKTNTVYEFMGYFWHGHPKYFHPNAINPRSKEKFGILYQKTLEKIEFLKNNGFIVIVKWG